MTRTNRYSPEVREREVRMMLEHEREYNAQLSAIVSIAAKIGCTPETLRKWVRWTEVDTGWRGGLKGSLVLFEDGSLGRHNPRRGGIASSGLSAM